jgi:cold shock CspA family protein
MKPVEPVAGNSGKGAEAMLTGKVVRFDDMRGYGFIAPDKGGEDVFVHANSLADDRLLFVPGLPVEFEVTEGERGLKAYAVRVIADRAEPAVPRPAVPRPAVPRPAVPRPAVPVATVTEPPAADDRVYDEELSDVLTAPAFRAELIDLLLESVPTLTAAQIGQLLNRLIELSERHGWVEN